MDSGVLIEDDDVLQVDKAIFPVVLIQYHVQRSLECSRGFHKPKGHADKMIRPRISCEFCLILVEIIIRDLLISPVEIQRWKDRFISKGINAFVLPEVPILG